MMDDIEDGKREPTKQMKQDEDDAVAKVDYRKTSSLKITCCKKNGSR